jgi:hypothetical protein
MNRDLQGTLFTALVSLMLLAGLFLRVVSFAWNDRLQGDVNLFALTAREFVLHDRLYYPMKYEYSDNVKYQVLRSPASQHPPLWSFVGGLLGKTACTDNTFFLLKVMCEIAGALLIAIIAYAGMRAGWPREALVAASCIALSPALIDFSANGSSYMMSAIVVTLATILLEQSRSRGATNYVLAGALCGLGLQVHSALTLMPVAFLAFWLWDRSLKLKGLIGFALAGLLALTPWMLWNLLHFGKPFYSYSSYYVLEKLGLTQTGIYGDVIATRISGAIDATLLKRYALLVAETIRAALRSYLSELGPFCLVLMLAGTVTLFKANRRRAAAFVLPYAIYAITISLWATFKYRFLVPLLPAAYAAAAFGFVELCDKRRFWRLAGYVCLLGTLAWGIPSFFEQPPTRYYLDDNIHAADYERMRPLAMALGSLEPGVTLGHSNSLDGGIETVYWHRFPFVYGRGFNTQEVQKLVHDFDVRYIWTDESTVHQIASEFPEARVILTNEPYYVFDLSDRD